MKFTTAMMFGFALIVGVAVGYMFNPSVEESAPAKREKAPAAIKDDGDAASIKALRSRIADLEAKLAEKDAKPAEEKVADNDDDRRERRRADRGGSMREWRERMKKDNPEGYAQMTNGIARMRRNRREQAQKKSEFFASVDVSKMSPGARKVHEELRDLIAKNEEFEQKMHAMHEAENDLSMEEMGEMFREMHETNRRISELNAKERENLMVEAAKGLGFSEADSGEVAGIFKEIIDNTDSSWGGFGGGRGRGGQRGGGQRGGGRR